MTTSNVPSAPAGPILIVEDVPNVLELLEVTLRFKGYGVITARNGEEALEVLQTQRPVLIITDILMPKLDGYAFVQKLRLNPETRNIPVVFLSATYVTPDDKQFALSLGAARFMEKPIDTEDFLLTVAELVVGQPLTQPLPLDMNKFYDGYRTRLEEKLRHKNQQIARAERLLPTLPSDQKPAFQSLLEQSVDDRNAIKSELYDIYQTIESLRAEAPEEPKVVELVDTAAETMETAKPQDSPVEIPDVISSAEAANAPADGSTNNK
jgi:CheY-like chemotaxis protein